MIKESELEPIGEDIDFKLKTELCVLLNKREAQGAELPFMDEVHRSIIRIKQIFNQEWVSVDEACVNCSSFRFSDEYPCTKFLLSLNNGVVPVNQFSCNFFTPQPPNNKGKGDYYPEEDLEEKERLYEKRARYEEYEE